MKYFLYFTFQAAVLPKFDPVKVWMKYFPVFHLSGSGAAKICSSQILDEILPCISPFRQRCCQNLFRTNFC